MFQKLLTARSLAKIAIAGGCAIATTTFGSRWYQTKLTREKAQRYESVWGPKVGRPEWSPERSVLESEIAIRPFVLEALKEHIFESKRLAEEAERIIVQKRASDSRIQARQDRLRELQQDLMRIEADRTAWLAVRDEEAQQKLTYEINMLVAIADRENKEEADRISAECAERIQNARVKRSILATDQITTLKGDIQLQLARDREHCEAQRRSAELPPFPPAVNE
jgi:hypothetical protein